MNAEQTSEKATTNCENSETSQIQPQSPVDPKLQEELNRFKEIQKNPQLLLQTLMEMEYQKQQRVKFEYFISMNFFIELYFFKIQQATTEAPNDMENDETIKIVEKECEKPLFLCHICGSMLQRNSMYAHLKLHNRFICDKENHHSVDSSKRILKGHRIIHG